MTPQELADTLASARAVLGPMAERLAQQDPRTADPARTALLELELDQLIHLARDLIHQIPDRSKITATGPYLQLRQFLHERRVLHVDAPCQ